MEVTVVLPTFNEEEAIEDMLKQLLSKNYDVVVIDSNSTDNTKNIAKNWGIKIISIKERGKAVAIKKAFEVLNSDVIVIIDADLSYDIDSIPHALSKLKECDVVYGKRIVEAGAMSPLHKFGNWFLTLSANILYGKCEDLCTGFWVLKKEVYKNIKIDAKGFELEANLFIETRKHKLCFIPIKYKKRVGSSKIRIIDGFFIFSYMIKKFLYEKFFNK